ncbi:hypothetical protein [Lysobacter capsici]|uniref:hypothetical protein n=1 Tax=Lysobacter capsici TaxID=435897 RepID=UPI00398CE8B1
MATERPERFFHTRLARLSLPALLLGSLIAMPAAAQRVGGEGQAHLGALWPAEPPARICGNTALLSNPDPMPANAVRVPAGDNSNIDFRRPNTTFWFESGVHTFSDEIYGQIIAQDNNVYLGAPGAILDGQNKNLYAFTNAARNVIIRYLTIRNFGRGATISTRRWSTTMPATTGPSNTTPSSTTTAPACSSAATTRSASTASRTTASTVSACTSRRCRAPRRSPANKCRAVRRSSISS